MSNGFFEPQVDKDLVRRAQSDDRSAHDALYRRFAPPVYQLAMRMTYRPEVAEDVVQEVFCELLRSITGFRDEAPIGGWIRQIAVNKCLSLLRSPWQRLRLPWPETDDSHGVTAPMAEPGNRQLEAALRQLKPASRAVLWLHDVEGYTHREIAAAMGRSVSFSKSQLARAHERLRQLLETDTEEDQLCMPTQHPC